jgi:uracil-DNA glycosylase
MHTIEGMTDAYNRLLEATIQHLEGLAARGVRFVSVSPDALRRLSQIPPVSKARPLPGFAAGDLRREPARAVVVSASPAAGTNAVLPTSAPKPPIPPALPVVTGLSLEAKAAQFAQLRERVLACAKCSHLASSRKNVVFGVGDPNAQLMFVGEAPGADEDERGEPFVGKAGELLTKIIQTMGLTRGSVYIANILKCRPDTPGQSSGNRKPTAEEMQTCIPYLHEQIDLIGPKVLVALGAIAVEGLLGKTVGITRLRGQWRTYRGIPLMPTYHPAYLLRNQAPSEKRRVWEDMLQVMERVGLPISEKQRNYFR